MLDRIVELDQSLHTADLVVKRLFEQNEFNKIAQLSVFQNLDKELDPETMLYGACSLESAGNTSLAKQYFEHLEQNHSENEQISHQLIVRLIKQGEYNSALVKIDNFLSKTNQRAKHAAFFSLKGLVLETQGKDIEALAALDQGLEINPRNDKILRMKFSILGKKSIGPSAISTLQELVNLSNDQQLRQLLINLYTQCGKFEQALEELQHINDNSFAFTSSKAALLVKLNRKKEAIPLIEQCLTLQPKHPQLTAIKLQLLFDTGKFDELTSTLLNQLKSTENIDQNMIAKTLCVALQCRNQEQVIRELLKLPGDRTQKTMRLMALADFAFSMGFYQHASHIYGMLEPIFCQNPTLKAKMLTAMGKINLEVGNKKEGLLQLRQAAKHCPQLLTCWKLLAQSSLQTKNFKRANVFLKKALALNPTDKSLHELKNKIYAEKMLNSQNFKILDILKNGMLQPKGYLFTMGGSR